MRLLLIVSICFIAVTSFAQEKSSYKFNGVSLADFKPTVYSIDSNATAIILADVGSTSFTGNKKGWFTLVFRRHTRIRILKLSAMGLATVRIGLYKKDNDEETLENVNASTFNEFNGTVNETKLDKHDVFTERQDKNHTEKKFSMPAIKEGSIVDISYTINSDFEFNLRPWTFQHVSYPCLWSEYSVAVPQLLNYIFLKQGFNKYYLEKKESTSQIFRVTLPSDGIDLVPHDQDLLVNTLIQKYRWAMKDIQAFHDVDYIASPDNYLDRIEFQLSQVSNGETARDVMNTWPKTTEELLKKEDFGRALTEDNSWLDKDLQNITGGISDQLAVSKKIDAYIKNNFTCTGHGYFIKTSLQDVFKTRKGNAGEINLILIAMLRKKGINSDPVLISTRDNGRAYKKYPIISRYNYAFCRANINNKLYYLDASHPLLAFGILDPECYYGEARVINSAAESFDLTPDSLHENKNTLVIVNDDHGMLSGMVNKVPGYYESYHMRNEIAKKGKDIFAAEFKKSFSGEGRINNLQLDSLDNLDKPLGMRYDFTLKPGTENVFYLNPMFGEGYEKNLFKPESRIYPVEMFFPANSTYILNLQIPEGYTLEEMPKSLLLKLNEQADGLFEYRIQQDDRQVSLRSRLVIKRTYFSAEEYDMLREFFNLVIKKQNEFIVFKKTN